MHTPGMKFSNAYQHREGKLFLNLAMHPNQNSFSLAVV